MSPIIERRALQVAVALGGIVPVSAGLSGALYGTDLLAGSPEGAAADSHLRYLSGLLLAISLGFWSSIPAIERRSARVRLLGAMVVVGGLARALGLLEHGWPGAWAGRWSWSFW